VQGVSVTGSERVARRSPRSRAQPQEGRSRARRIDPFILLSTDDLDAAVQAGVDARLDNNGQSCNGAKRFIVADDLYDAFVEKFTAAMAAAKVGDRSPRTPCSAAVVARGGGAAAGAGRSRRRAGRDGGDRGSRDGAFFPAPCSPA
jgi:succinate-semialdehyde dehydrogenase/glutarate-semialdehyde dehydrogenase